MKKLLFLANIQYGQEPTGGGVQTRNQFMLVWLKKKFDVRFFDTWNKLPIISLISSLFLVIIYKKRLVIVSYGGRGALILMKTLNFIRCKRTIKLFIPGGDLLGIVKKHDIYDWSCFDEILVQSKQMVSDLNKQGLSNISYCPNFKIIDYRPFHKEHQNGDLLRFVYVGRLFEKKGIDILIDACKTLEENFQLTIYGKETEKYNAGYFDNLNDKRIIYKGYLNLNKKDGYDELATHDVLIFPTFYSGEGFSGILIDAFICGLPVIATDMNVNTEIVVDGATGIIIPPANIKALSDAMKRFIKGEVDINMMSKKSYETAICYDINTVLGNVING